MEMLEKSLRMNLLFDFYGDLLTEKQRELFRLYYQEDLTLGEAARIHNSSRQAVFDSLRRAAAELERYEEVLGLAKAHKEREALIERLSGVLDEIEAGLEQDKRTRFSEARKLLERLREV